MNLKKYKRAFVVSIVILLVGVIAYILGWSTLLTVKQIEITGTSSQAVISNQLASKEITLTPGMKLARVDVRGINRSLSEMKWLDTYSIKRSWISRDISIAVIEKTAVAKAKGANSQLLYFDKNGEIFKPISAKQIALQSTLPLVISDKNEEADLAEVALLLAMLPDGFNELLAGLDGISIGKSGFIVMKSAINGKSVRINWGRADHVAQKIKVLQALVKLPENKAASNFDLSLPTSPIVS
jgi:cell division septal protein FtsQ